MNSQKQKGGGAKKHGRNKKQCEAYKIMASRLVNKIKRLKRHIRRNQKMVDRKNRNGLTIIDKEHPGGRPLRYDKRAQSALKRLAA